MHSFVTSKNAQWRRLIWPTLYNVLCLVFFPRLCSFLCYYLHIWYLFISWNIQWSIHLIWIISNKRV